MSIPQFEFWPAGEQPAAKQEADLFFERMRLEAEQQAKQHRAAQELLVPSVTHQQPDA